jgi:glycosyltransferase involved in cell wall biosynthesis
MKLKTLHLANAYHPTSGGIGTFYRALMAEANLQKREMVLIAPGETDRVEHQGPYCRIYYLKAPAAPLFDSRYRLILPQRYLPKQSRIREILLQEQPCIVEIGDKYSLNYLGGLIRRNWIAGLQRPLVIGISHERMDDNVSAYLTRSSWGTRFASWYMRTIYFRLFDEHVANSHYTAEELIAASKGHNVPRGVHLLPMGVDTNRFHPGLKARCTRAAIYQRFDIPVDAKTILYAGRLAPEKNVGLLPAVLQRLLAQVPDVDLLIAGQGPSQPSLQQALEKQLAGHFQFLGHLNANDLAALVANVDVFVHPNAKEPFGIAPLEAMACGTPLVAPDEGGVTTYANPANAWVVPADPHSFSKAIIEALSDPFGRNIKTERAILTARQFAWPKVASRFFALYDELYWSSVARRDSLPMELLETLKN